MTELDKIGQCLSLSLLDEIVRVGVHSYMKLAQPELVVTVLAKSPVVLKLNLFMG